MSQPSKTIDKAGEHHWESTWQASTLPRLVAPNDPSLRNHVRRCIHTFLAEVLQGRRGLSVIEVGCANSVWLPYFAQQHGCHVTGLDYSDAGCTSARKILSLANVSGEVFLGDLWEPPTELMGSFDLVFTYGLVEHFDPTDSVLRALANLLRPGGTMITIVPNMSGWAGTVQKFLNRPVFDIHVPMDVAILDAAHKRAGLMVSQSGYLCAINFGLVNLDGTTDGRLMRVAKRLFTKMLIGLSALVWCIEDHSALRLRPNRLTSPYIVCVADKEWP